jgi:quercetin dioxygenase-like cupin family protein
MEAAPAFAPARGKEIKRNGAGAMMKRAFRKYGAKRIKVPVVACLKGKMIFQTLAIAALSLLPSSASAQLSPESDESVVCKPASERKTELGCWILADNPIGQLGGSEVYWYLDVYPTLYAAEQAKEPDGTVIKALGKIWLLTIAKSGWRPVHPGEHAGTIGPIPIHTGSKYSSQFMEANFAPGMHSRIHVHSGAEAWFTVAGKTCLETPQGELVSYPGGPAVIIPEGLPMKLTAVGNEQRRGLVLILHDSSSPATTPVHDWQPKGLCEELAGTSR